MPDDLCPMCGTMMSRCVGALRELVNGQSIVVPGIAHLHCRKCGEILLDGVAERTLREAAFASYRSAHGLLTPGEIRTLRRSLGLTQRQLARLLRLGPNTLSRWEAGSNVQSAAMDILLRMMRDVPGTLAYLRRRAA